MWLHGRSLPQVRAKADKAKEKIQIFLADWKDNSAVSSETSYVAITGAWVCSLGSGGEGAPYPMDGSTQVPSVYPCQVPVQCRGAPSHAGCGTAAVRCEKLQR